VIRSPRVDILTVDRNGIGDHPTLLAASYRRTLFRPLTISAASEKVRAWADRIVGIESPRVAAAPGYVIPVRSADQRIAQTTTCGPRHID
jgi:hypothetical protein